MTKHSSTYRLFTMFTAMLIAVSITLPSLLMAAAHCNMDEHPSPVSSESNEYCILGDSAAAHNSSGHTELNSSTGNCNWTLHCEISQPDITSQTIPNINKTAKSLAVSVIRYIGDKPTSTPAFTADPEGPLTPNLPPLFLLNKAFLN